MESPAAHATTLLLLLVVLAHCVSIRGVAEARAAGVGSNVSSADEEATTLGRMLYGKKGSHHRGYYISYAALSANYIPCPPRSGRSYYTNNCDRATASVNPYSRGCSCISHCRTG